MTTWMFRLPSVMTSDELLDKAFKRVSKVSVRGRDKKETAKRSSIKKIEVLKSVIASDLTRYQKKSPSVDNLHPFYFEIVDILVGRDDLKRSLGALKWCAEKSSEIGRTYIKSVRRARSHAEIETLRKEAFGRISSLVKQTSSNLDFLIEAKKRLRRMPSIDPEVPTIVIAGYPNVGKSLIVRAMSSGKPRVENYPFTTKKVSLGHFDKDRTRFQVIDTPGLLDREMAERNEIERQAIAALRFLAHAIVFVLDMTETCGYEVAKQENLLRDVSEQFQDIPLLAVENKSDLMKRDSPRLQMSALTGDGVEEVRRVAAEAAMSRALEVARAQESR
ncbi:MAG: 50S ribosome-binding GTPase [Thermoplasmata archaeon]|nr:50S ribosome-binding GTPase [Candidatus Thermoplasmatota archaeon]MCK4949012.1 50S ribosome-binding GTPase [Thermoplasmata archaeon]